MTNPEPIKDVFDFEGVMRQAEITRYGKLKSEMNEIELAAANEIDKKAIEQKNQEDSERARLERIAQRQEAIDRMLSIYQIPARYAEAKLSNMLETCDAESKVIERCKKYSSGKQWKNGTSLIFLGTAGCGKTHIGCSIAKSLFDPRKHDYQQDVAYYTTMVKLVREIQDTYNRNSEKTTTEVMEFFFNVDLLVIDEIGAQRGTTDEKLHLFEILRERHANMKATILISNLGVKDFKDHVGDLIVDRLREDNSEMLIFNWKSHRG